MIEKWYKIGAEGRNFMPPLYQAEFMLGNLYADGRGVPTDYKKALKWYKRAAENKFLSYEKEVYQAQYMLGILYEEGLGVLQNFIKAHMWFNISASSGSVTAADARKRISKQMTPSQIEKAQDLARECVKKEYKGC